MNFPTLFHRGKAGKLYQWRVYTEGDTIYSEAGSVDGLKILSSKRATPKNTGKANATTASGQADKEAAAKHKFKLDRKYSLTPKDAQNPLFLPMLAQNFEKRKKKDVVYPISMQPKLDGCRALAQWEGNSIALSSRSGKPWPVLAHIARELEKILPENTVLDGELYIHGVGFQTLSSLMKREQEESLKIEFHVYDIPVVAGDDSLTWAERDKALTAFFKDAGKLTKIVHVKSRLANNEEEVLAFHAEAVADGHEGAIARNLHGIYEFSYRSYDLLKVKSFSDDEFLVTGVENGVGKFDSCAIWVCQTKDGKAFRAVPKVTQETKEEYLRDAKKYIGRKVTVVYFGLTNEGIPRFPVAKGFRPENDS